MTDALQGKDDLSVECGLLAFVRNERILIIYRKTKPYLLWFTKNGVFLMSLESIEQQKEKIAQQKAKLLQKEKELKDQERKLLTKRKIELGGLIYKAEVQKFSKETILGHLLKLKEFSPKEILILEENGKENFLAKFKNKVKLSFKSAPNEEDRAVIKENGFRWNSENQIWWGEKNNQKIKDIVKKYKGKIWN